MKRSSGILLHITSLPSKYGIGSMGESAYRFVDFLKKAGQSYWQILPLNPPGYGNSPYQAFSTFAGNPHLIDLDRLAEQGLLRPEEPERETWGERADQVDFQHLYTVRMKLLRKAFERFRVDPPAAFCGFVRSQKTWLEEYALFMAVKARYSDGPWIYWPLDIRMHRPEAIAHHKMMLQDEMQFHYFLQYEFHTQWQALRSYANENGVRIIGDIPIYVPLDSADVWSHPENFQLSRTRHPRVVAGCPPDGFNAGGQYWGNPIYDWEKMERDGFSWWMERLRAAAERFDVVRIDHFRGIESYWSIPAANRTARRGAWVKGPGIRLIDAIRKNLTDVDFIAEDLGFLTPEVIELVHASGFPGMKVLEFAFDPREPSNYLPHKYDQNCICYTGTHDNETLAQWCAGLDGQTEAYARNYLGITPQDDLADAIITAGMQSKAMLFIAQMQDYLRLGAESRMNEPGRLLASNWRWRMTPGQDSDALAAQILELTRRAGRV